jgi:hypothetical protein
MRKLLADKEHVYHLHEYAILENGDGTYDYMAWETNKESRTLTWIRGESSILDDVLCLRSIASEGEEEAIKTSEELSDELQSLPKWDKTKYYGVIIADSSAGRMNYCETGRPVQKDGEDYQTIKNRLVKHGVRLL